MARKEYGEPHRRYIDPDRLAGECDDQLPLISKIGRGPRGHGVTPRVRTDQPGEYVVEFVDDVTGEVVLATANLSAGEVTVTVDTPENPVAGDTVMATIHVRLGDATRDYSLPIPPGATGSIFFEVDGEVAASHDGTYRVDVGRLASWGNLNRPSRPVPRVNDMVVFTTPTGFGFGTIEAVENGQVIFTSRTGFELPVFGVTDDGHLTIDGEDTGVSCVGPAGRDAVSPDLTVTREDGGVSIVATDHRGTTEAKVLDGTDGVSPTIVASRIEGGHRLDIDSAAGEATVDVMDGIDGEDGLPATMVVRSVTETQQPTVSVQRTDAQTNTFSMDFGLPRGADGKSIDIQGGVYKVDQLPDFDDTPVNRAFIVSNYEGSKDYQYDLYIRGVEPVIAEEGGPWTVIEDWQGMPGFSIRYIHGTEIDADAPIQVAESDIESTFIPSAHIADGDLVIDDHGCLGVIGSATDNNGYVTVTYVTKLQVHWEDVLGKPSDLVHTADLTAAIAAEASARDKADKLLETEIDGKLGPEDIVAGKGISVTHDPEGGHVTIDNAMEFFECKKGAVLEFDGMLHSDPSARPLGMTVYGATKQNLWSNPSNTENGVTVKSNANGSITLSGTPVNITTIRTGAIYVLRPGTTYTASIDKNTPAGVIFSVFLKAIDDTTLKQVIFGEGGESTSATFTVPTDGFAYVKFDVFFSEQAVGQTVSGTYRVMLNEGSESEPWCPPGLNGVKDLSVICAGKNLWVNPPSSTINGVTLTSNDDGSFTLDGSLSATSPNGTYFRVSMATPPSDTQMTLSVDSALSENYARIILQFFDSGDLLIGGSNYVGFGDTLSKTMTVPKNTDHMALGVYLISSAPIGTTVSGTFRPQLELGSAVTDYESPAVGDYPIYLDGHILHSLPDGTRDELVVDAGGNMVLMQWVGVATAPTAADSWLYEVDMGYASFELPSTGPSSQEDETSWLLCDRLPVRQSFDDVSYAVVGTTRGYAKNPTITDSGTAAGLTCGATYLYPLTAPRLISLPPIDGMPRIQQSHVTMFAASNVPTEMRACLPTEDAGQVLPIIDAEISASTTGIDDTDVVYFNNRLGAYQKSGGVSASMPLFGVTKQDERVANGTAIYPDGLDVVTAYREEDQITGDEDPVPIYTATLDKGKTVAPELATLKGSLELVRARLDVADDLTTWLAFVQQANLRSSSIHPSSSQRNVSNNRFYALAGFLVPNQVYLLSDKYGLDPDYTWTYVAPFSYKASYDDVSPQAGLANIPLEFYTSRGWLYRNGLVTVLSATDTDFQGYMGY